ncbi:AIP3-domain-containing protein [Calocera viscosa TUFC12733]|uniref:AIP3-domain-containing protein n=1 Tax=Calocera viscosa (strain TUFC12733) TaxID=1330018 RepID=A0A167S8V4_CALVF|nr:AIP3-domain-containing protein [Calocera viscosa TUFC12733]
MSTARVQSGAPSGSERPREYSVYSTGSTRSERAPESSSGSQSRREGRARSGSSSGNGVETTVTRLLVAIKQLLESLTLWSQMRATENQVSDVYVRLGNDFNAAVAAFASCGIDMTELLSVPQDLRDVLELCLAEEATTASLERYLPTVRTIITNLLNGLRTKQSEYRRQQATRPSRTSGSGGSRSSRALAAEAAPQPPDDARSVVTPSSSRSREHRSVPTPTSSRGSSNSAYRRPATQSVDESRAPTGMVESRSQSSLTNTSTDRGVGGFVPQRRRDDASGSFSGTVPENETPSRPASRSSARTPSRTGQSTVLLTSNDSPPPEGKRELPRRGPSLSARGIASIPEEPSSPIKSQMPSLPPPVVPPDVRRFSLSDKPMTPGKDLPSPPLGGQTHLPELPEGETKTALPPNEPSPPPHTPPAHSAPDVVVSEASPGTPIDASADISRTDDTQPSAYNSPLASPPITKADVQPLAPTGDEDRATNLGAQNSFAALQRSDMLLERRASKRFSTFNFMRMGASGPSTRDKQTAAMVQNRRSLIPADRSFTSDLGTVTEGEESSAKNKGVERSESRTRLPETPTRQSPSPKTDEVPPLPPLPAFMTGSKSFSNGLVKSDSAASDLSNFSSVQGTNESSAPVTSTPIAQSHVEASLTRISSSGNLTVFLTLGMHTKKVEMESTMSFAGLRILFMDKFSYNPGLENFPAIYIEDPSSRIRYELENLDDVQNGSRLLLNVEPLDQVKQHIDLQISAVSQDIRELKQSMAASRRMSVGPQYISPTSGAPAAPRPSDVQFQAAASKLSKMKLNPAARPPPLEPIQPQMTGASDIASGRIFHDLQTQFDEVQNIRRDLGVMRQLYVDFINQTKEALGGLRVQTNAVRELADTKVGGTRAYINAGKDKLDTRSQDALTKIEELTDSVEVLKGDVVKRQVLPKPAVMKQLKSDIDACATELESLSQHVSTIKPMWKKTWGEELENIVEEQKFLTHQEELLADLIEDHKALREVFGHVEKFISLKGSGGSQKALRSYRPPPPEEKHGGLSTVMMEIRGAQVDPERRLKAIEAAQKQRDRELASRSDEFQAELSNFVDGKKLKMTGGPEEVERIRQKRNDQTLKAMFGGSTSSNSLTDLALPTSPMSPSGSVGMK